MQSHLLSFVVDDGEGLVCEVQHVREVVERNNDNSDHHFRVSWFPERIFVMRHTWQVPATFERLVQLRHVHLSVEELIARPNVKVVRFFVVHVNANLILET